MLPTGEPCGWRGPRTVLERHRELAHGIAKARTLYSSSRRVVRKTMALSAASFPNFEDAMRYRVLVERKKDVHLLFDFDSNQFSSTHLKHHFRDIVLSLYKSYRISSGATAK